MVYAGAYEKSMKEHKRKIGKINVPTESKSEFKKVVDETVTVLKQNGYDKGADILAEILDN